ncbi:hypothetical protein AVEN_91587-1 [Araneus ventricosus]|uniref:DUF4219 domain-containing protein n=1 Tax=Araneus ventricosus TaxID=182803 RepID=A0A4Y2CNL9_ARAVE|nr:hypothetical protein AVEN_91587-1 [Araneus ventricosus]
MNMPAESSPFAFPKLDGSNYTSWKENMKVVLMDCGCWSFIIEEDKPYPEQATEKEFELNYLNSKKNLADFLTKPLVKEKFLSVIKAIFQKDSVTDGA